MRDVIWLRVDRTKVHTMTKGQPQLGRGELAIKINVEVDDGCWGSPSLEQSIHIVDWRQGMDFPDVKLTDLVISEDEAARIRRDRELRIVEELRHIGYKITAPEDEEEDPDG